MNEGKKDFEASITEIIQELETLTKRKGPQPVFLYLDYMESIGADPLCGAELIYQLRRGGYEYLADILEAGEQQFIKILDILDPEE